MEEDKPFVCGVIEGFYGKPWTADQRKELFSTMERFGMQTYMYAPKDDYKHRLYWRDLYSQDEEDDMKDLIESAKEFGISFVYAISPGLDISFSNKEDIIALKKKLEQVKNFGCNSYALLFDDIEPDLCEEDRNVFTSSADAQASVTNDVYKSLGKPDVFLFCPTEYCTSRANPTLQKSEYLKTIGKQLDYNIDVLWTGPKVVSRRITIESIIEIKEILRRPPTIWDNIHANDYDQTRLFLGPYDGRPTELTKHLRGVLTNPNCEYEVNFVAIHTLAQWSKNRIQRFPTLDADAMDVDPPKTGYQPKRALFCAIEDWIPQFYKSKGACPSKKVLQKIHEQKKGQKEANEDMTITPRDKVEDETMEIADNDVNNATNEGTDSCDTKDCQIEPSETYNEYSSVISRKSTNADVDNAGSPMDTTKELDRSKESDNSDNKIPDLEDKMSDGNKNMNIKVKRRIDSIGFLEMDDIVVLCDLFYLPYEYGTRAIRMLKISHWLTSNAGRVKDIDKQKLPICERTAEVQEWYEKAIQFHDCFNDVVVMVDKLVNVPNRVLLYDLYNYVSDMRCALSLVNSYIKWHGMGKPDKEPFRGGEQEPWVHRSGIYSEFRRLLSIEGASDMFPMVEKQPEPIHCYTIRPYFKEDKDDLYSICLKTCDNGLDGSDMFDKYPDLAAEDCIGGLLEICPEYCFVMEDDAGLCGYAICAKDMHEYQKRMSAEWLVKMKEKYPDPCPNKKEDFNVIEGVVKTFHTQPIPIPDAVYLKYPSLIYMSVLSNRVEGIASSRRLLKCAIKTLKANGSNGVHTMIHSSHFNLLSYYTRLEFEDITDDKHLEEDVILMGRPI